MIYPFYLRALEVIYIRGEFHGLLSFHKLLHLHNTHLSQFFQLLPKQAKMVFHLELHLYLLKLNTFFYCTTRMHRTDINECSFL